MIETASVGELESIAQAIALADGFQLLVLECERFPPWYLDQLLNKVQQRVAELRGKSPSIIVITDPRAFAEWIVDVLVIDGTKVDPTGGARDESNWRFLFQRLNERRNAIIRISGGTMILALAPSLSRIFLEEAPDMASIRSGMFHIDATRLQANLEPQIQPVAQKTQEQQIRRITPVYGATKPVGREVGAKYRLRELLLSLFRTSELLRFVRYNFPDMMPSLPGSVAPSDLALAIVDQLGARGSIDRSLFERLAQVCPSRTDEIDEVATLWGYQLAPLAKRRADFSVPSDLHERLLELTESQNKLVLYLAGFAGDDSVTMTPLPTSAWDLIERARSEGPEGLARLADAIDIVKARE